MKKKILALIISTVMVASFVIGCGGNGTTGTETSDAVVVDTADINEDDANGVQETDERDISDIRIGVSIGHTQEERWQREIEMFRAFADEYGFELLVQSAENDVQNQIAQSENLIVQGIDVLILQSIDADAVSPIIETAHAEGVPVISYDRFAMNCAVDFYITFDSFDVGAIQAQFVVDMVSSGNFIWLKGSPDDNNAHLVADGQRSVLQPLIDSGDIHIVMEQWCIGWDPMEALQHTENALTAMNNDVQAVIASNDGTAGGAIQALSAAGLNIPIAGQDADLAACQRIVEGTQTGTVYKPLWKLNRAAMELAVALALGEDPMTSVDLSLGEWTTLYNGYGDIPTFNIEVTPIDVSNIYEILIVQEQFHSLEDVFRNVPREEWPGNN
ncbi:MAG: substrate-binding domain-containing protein [Lachnospiraceae bacterium]|nr:substrate-binding domain-containing protein [Lachnospiraceae bacterium]